jgi:hypothetical protein
MSDGQSTAAQAFGKAVAAATAEGAKLLAVGVAGATLPALLVEPTSAALGAVVEVFVTSIFDQTVDVQRQMDAKLDRILAEPLEKAKNIIYDVLHVEISNAGTLDEIDRQLTESYDSLLTALAYAEKHDVAAVLGVRAYLALVAAMTRNGGDFARLQLKQIRRSANEVRAKRAALEERARHFMKEAEHEHELMEQSDLASQFSPEEFGSASRGRLAAMHARSASSHRAEAERLTREADELRDVPERMEEFCLLVEALTDPKRPRLLGFE